MPSRNHGAFIGFALQSLLGQTFHDFEVLVLDYDSADETWQILESMQDPRIKALRFQEPGMGRALNHGFSLARGDYLTWFQADNQAFPTWLEEMVAVLDSQPEVDFVYSHFEHMDEQGRTIEEVGYGPFDADRLLAYCLVGPTFLYRRSVYETVGDYLDSHPRDDHDYWLRVWKNGFAFLNIPRNLGRNRLHQQTRLQSMREEYDASLRELFASNIHEAQNMGVELFRVRDIPLGALEVFCDSWKRFRSRIRYFLDFFTAFEPPRFVAVHGSGALQMLALDILDELGAEYALFEEQPGRKQRLGLPVLDPETFLARDDGHLLVCVPDTDDLHLSRLMGLGIPRERIVRLFALSPPPEVLQCPR